MFNINIIHINDLFEFKSRNLPADS